MAARLVLVLRRATKMASWQATSNVSSAATVAYKVGRGETLLGAVPDTMTVITGCCEAMASAVFAVRVARVPTSWVSWFS